MVRLRDQYDWIVMGDHPGALLSGCLAARQGLSVLILSLTPSQSVQASPEGYWLDPESNFLAPFEIPGQVRGLLGECLDHLGITSAEKELFRSDDRLFQVLTPDYRISVCQDLDEFAWEMKREFGPDVVGRLALPDAMKAARDSLIRYWALLPQRLTWSNPASQAGAQSSQQPSPRPARHPDNEEDLEVMASLKKVRRNLIRENRKMGSEVRDWISQERLLSARFEQLRKDSLSAWASGVWYGATLTPGEDFQQSQHFHALAQAMTGTSFRGGISAYRAFLLRLAQRLGADVPEKTHAQTIFVEDGRFKGVLPSHHGTMIGASGGVLGCSLAHARERLTLSGRTRLGNMKNPPVPAGWKFTIALSVHIEALPPGITRRMVWKEKNAPALEIEVAVPTDFGFKERQERLIFLRTVLPFAEESLKSEYQQLVAARMLKKFLEIIPFAEYHIVRIFPDFRAGVNERKDLEEVYPFQSTAQIPENLRCFEGEGVGARSGVEGLFVASGEAFPKLGCMGPVVAGVEGSAWIAHRSGLPGPFG